MLASVRGLTVALAVLTGCVGVVGEIASETRPEDAATGRPRDAGPRASVRIDAGVDIDVEPGTGGDDDVTPTDRDARADIDSLPEGACSESQLEPLANGLHIREIALYQTVKVPLVRNGAWLPQRSVPVVQGKKSMVRVFVDTLPGYRPHNVRAVLHIGDPAEPTQIADQKSIASNSTDAQLSSTFTFQVDGELLTDATKLSVSLLEASCDDELGAAEDARFPFTGTQELEATAIDKLEVVLVPVRTDGRVPVTNAAEVQKMRSALLAFYPVPDVEVRVREPLEWTDTVDALDGASWSNLLSQIVRERRNDAPAANVYYFGLVQPAATFRTYCARGCVLGLAPQTTSVMSNAQVGLGASFADAQTYETMVHELGHAHGRGHAPCVENGEIDGVDPGYPDPIGSTATWGWDSRTNMLQPPTHKDIMGYCEPNWISAYNYGALATRSAQVNQKAKLVGAPDEHWDHILLYANHGARWAGMFETRMPAGKLESADVLDARGNAIERIEVVRIPLSHTGDAWLYIPEAKPSWSALRLRDQTLTLSAIQPAL